jgi:hypothetical protein
VVAPSAPPVVVPELFANCSDLQAAAEAACAVGGDVDYDECILDVGMSCDLGTWIDVAALPPPEDFGPSGIFSPNAVAPKETEPAPPPNRTPACNSSTTCCYGDSASQCGCDHGSAFVWSEKSACVETSEFIVGMSQTNRLLGIGGSSGGENVATTQAECEAQCVQYLSVSGHPANEVCCRFWPEEPDVNTPDCVIYPTAPPTAPSYTYRSSSTFSSAILECLVPSPTAAPTPSPTAAPTPSPVPAPTTASPTAQPTVSPTPVPFNCYCAATQVPTAAKEEVIPSWVWVLLAILILLILLCCGRIYFGRWLPCLTSTPPSTSDGDGDGPAAGTGRSFDSNLPDERRRRESKTKSRVRRWRAPDPVAEERAHNMADAQETGEPAPAFCPRSPPFATILAGEAARSARMQPGCPKRMIL